MYSLMHRKVGVRGERLPAVTTLVGFLPSVSSHVFLHRGEVVKGLATAAAFVGLLASVDPLVHGQGEAAAEGLAALPAHVRLLSGVRPRVLRQVRALPERLAAVGALVRLLPSVDAVVAGEGGPGAEGLPALTTLVMVLPRVGSLVAFEVAARAKDVEALVTLVGLLSGVDPHVQPQGGGVAEGLPAVAASVRLLPVMDPPVDGEVGPAAEALAALAAVVGLLSGVRPLVLSKVRLCAEDLEALITFVEFHAKMISLRFYTTRTFFSKNMLLRSYPFVFKYSLQIWTGAWEKSSLLCHHLAFLLQMRDEAGFINMMPERGQVPAGLQHHVSVQLPLGRVQQSPLFLGKLNGHILEGHQVQEPACQETINKPFLLCASFLRCWVQGRRNAGGEQNHGHGPAIRTVSLPERRRRGGTRRLPL